MTEPRDYESKIVSIADMCKIRERLRAEGKTVAFTNGCFDILHAGHVDLLAFARRQGDALLMAINSDASVTKNKGPGRPIVRQQDRVIMLAALEVVDYVTIFDDDEPIELLSKLLPDILVKGSDWKHYVSGREIVENSGGRVVLAPVTDGRSTTHIVEKIREQGTG